MYKFILLTFIFHVHIITGYSQIENLRKTISAITNGKNAKVGVSVLSFDKGDTLTFNNDFRFAMQSVYKFHLALMVLHQVDEGKLALNQKVYIKKSDLLPNTWSPIRDKYPAGNVELTISDLLRFTVSQSDNVGCDRLFRLVGGTKKVDKYLHQIGVKEVAVKGTEEEMHKDWNVQYTNWTKPSAATQLLDKFYRGNILSDNSRAFLWKIMVETVTGVSKMKALLPTNTVVAHKTGYSGANQAGLTGATNDIGIMTLPNGKQVAVAIFVNNSMENEKTNDQMIAEITKATWDYFVVQ